MKACCGFGHRSVFENITESLDKAVIEAVQEGCEVFYTGAMGDFDRLYSCAVRKAKVSYPHIKLVCVKPYFTNDINKGKIYYEMLYDDIIIPSEILGIHYKAAIKARNRWIVDNSDLVISYVIRNYGGAADALKYAEKKKKKTVSII